MGRYDIQPYLPLALLLQTNQMRLLFLLLFSIQATAQYEPECKKIYDPWESPVWTKTLRGKFIQLYIAWGMSKPCDSPQTSRVITIDRPIIDSISQQELDYHANRWKRWVFNNKNVNKPPRDKYIAGEIDRMIIITDCPPNIKDPLFVVYTKKYYRKINRRGFFKRLFYPR